MAKKNKNQMVAGESLISNAPLKDAELSVENTSRNKNNKKSKGKNTDKKPNFFVRMRKVFKEMFSELKKVSWPTAKKTFSMLGIVLVVVFFFLVIISAFDYGIMQLIRLLMDHSIVG